MKKLALRFTFALVTFVIGVLVTNLWAFNRRLPDVEPRASAVQPAPLIAEAAPEIDPHWVYITKDIQWELPPKEVIEYTGRFYTGYGRLAVLNPSGDLAIASCNFRKDARTRQISLDGVVDFSVFRGTWSYDGEGAIVANFRYCMSAHARPRTGLEPTITHRWLISKVPSPGRVAAMLESEDRAEAGDMVPLPDDFRDIGGLQYMLKSGTECQ
jgi:hypothetical protein